MERLRASREGGGGRERGRGQKVDKGLKNIFSHCFLQEL